MSRAGMHQIGAVAQEVGMSIQDIRRYAETGLVQPSGRTAVGLGLYTDHDIARLRLVRQMQALHFTHDEMVSLLDAQHRLVEDGGDAPVIEDASVDDIGPAAGPDELERLSAGELSLDDLRRLTSGELFADELELLESAALTGAQRARIIDRLSMFSAAVDERCRQLREQLDEAETTASTLRRELRRHSRSIEMRG